MELETILAIAVPIALIALILAYSIRIVKEYEKGVIFRLGRVVGARGPGLFFIIPVVEQMVKVNLQVVTMDIPPQDVITRDNVTIRVNAVTYFRVEEPINAIVNVQNYGYATQQVAQTTLRNIVGRTSLDDLLTEREQVNAELQQIIDQQTNPWGVKVTIVELKDVELPESMRRAMASQAEAERDRRARVIHALGEQEAAAKLTEAAAELERHPAAMQLRLLGTMSDVAAEKNSTLIFPLPVEMLRFFESMTPPSAEAR